jgi:hypothetical protein
MSATLPVHVLDLPDEVLLNVFEVYLTDHCCIKHSRMPKNDHLRLQLICRRIYATIGSLLQQYLSLYDDDISRKYCSLPDFEDRVRKLRQLDILAVSTLHNVGP